MLGYLWMAFGKSCMSSVETNPPPLIQGPNPEMYQYAVALLYPKVSNYSLIPIVPVFLLRICVN